MALEHIRAPIEFKFAGDAEPGVFEGYGSVFGNIDSHGDIVAPGAFARSMAEHKSAGSMPAMYLEHGLLGGDHGLPAGVWLDMQEDSRGLKTKGKLSGMDTDYGKRLRSLMQDGALRGQSIGFRVHPGGADFSKGAGARRTLKSVHLAEVSIVRDPSNALATVEGIKAVKQADADKAAISLAAAMKLHAGNMANHYSDASPRDKALLMNHLRDAHMALTGDRAPADMPDWKAAPTHTELKAALLAAGISEEQAEIAAAAALETKGRPSAGDDVSGTLDFMRSLLINA